MVISNFRSIVLGLIFASIGILENLLKILLNPINYIRCSLQCLSRLKEISKYQLLNLLSRVVLKLFKTIPIPEPCKNNKTNIHHDLYKNSSGKLNPFKNWNVQQGITD